MNQRLERLTARVLEENRCLFLNDSMIAERILNADKEKRPRIIREAYSKLIEIDEDSFLVGQYTNVSLLESVKRKGLADELKALANKYSRYKNRLYIPAGDHLTADFDYVLKNGISGFVEQINQMQKTAVGEGQSSFLSELYFTAQSAIAWTQAYVDALHNAAQKCTSKKRRAELLQMADICAGVFTASLKYVAKFRIFPRVASVKQYKAIILLLFCFPTTAWGDWTSICIHTT